MGVKICAVPFSARVVLSLKWLVTLVNTRRIRESAAQRRVILPAHHLQCRKEKVHERNVTLYATLPHLLLAHGGNITIELQSTTILFRIKTNVC
mmetsp:Transcript_5212/g.9786  ORF Transcript_5212/g.9786 Transcript_5212/m.9786 type:complete len:94 (-) Transcript_5212:296-577(-)